MTEDELDRLALAIERVLPKDIRLAATAKRQQARSARRAAQRETQRQILIAARAERRAARDAARASAGVLYEADFPIRGATRFEERRQACERLMVDDNVKLEREPDNVHDSNAILILGGDDCELGYVPREEARDIAPLLDAGAEADARVHRLWETPEGKIVPIVLVKVRQGHADPSAVKRSPQRRSGIDPVSRTAPVTKPQGCGAAAACFLLLLVLILVAVIRSG